MRQGIILFSAFIVGTFAATAQDVREAYDLSNTAATGSARSMGFGGALGSVGGDFTSTSVNPAGLGIYRSSETSITPSLKINSATGDYAGTSATELNTKFNLNNVAFVFTNAPKGRRYDKHDWKAVSFAFGMNRIGDFNRKYSYAGHNNTSSASQVFEADANMYPGDANGTGPSSAPGYIGYQSYLLNKDANGAYYSIVPFTGGINQMKSIKEKGRITEYVVALGGNYKEKLMLGMTLGIPSFNYRRNSYLTETVDANNPNNPNAFNSFTYSQDLSITGLGINAKFGAIYKFSDIFRAGVALHTPTYYAISNVWTPSITSSAQGFVTTMNSDYDLVSNEFDYNLSTPWKGVVSATLMLGKRGFITADYEYVDYSSTRFHYPTGSDAATMMTYQQQENDLNNEIKKTYEATSNVRVGAEVRLGKTFMIRGGFGYYGDPYTPYGKATQPAMYTTERIDATVGLGFRFRHTFTDIALVRSMYQGYEQPYNVIYKDAAGNPIVHSGAPATVPTAKMDYVLNNIAWTFGVKF